MGSKTPKQTTQINKTELSPQNQLIADEGAKLALNYAKTPLRVPNYSIADFNANEIEGQNSALAAARGQMAQLAQQAGNTNSFLMDPALLSPDSNPYLRAQGDTITRLATNNLLEKILPALRSGSVVSGGFHSGGNTRYGLAEGEAVGRTNQEVTSALASLYGGAYQNGLQTLLSATGQNGNILKQLLYPSTVLSGVGQQQRQLFQAQNDNATQLDWLQQQLPFMQAQQLYGLANSGAGNSGSSTVTGAQPSSGGLIGGLGGAASGAALGSAILPGVGTAAGAIGGGLLGLLS